MNWMEYKILDNRDNVYFGIVAMVEYLAVWIVNIYSYIMLNNAIPGESVIKGNRKHDFDLFWRFCIIINLSTFSNHFDLI